MAQKRKLNRGLEALLGTGLLAKGQDAAQDAQVPAAAQGAAMPSAELPIERLQRGAYQPRREFDEEALKNTGQ